MDTKYAVRKAELDTEIKRLQDERLKMIGEAAMAAAHRGWMVMTAVYLAEGAPERLTLTAPDYLLTGKTFDVRRAQARAGVNTNVITPYSIELLMHIDRDAPYSLRFDSLDAVLRWIDNGCKVE